MKKKRKSEWKGGRKVVRVGIEKKSSKINPCVGERLIIKLWLSMKLRLRGRHTDDKGKGEPEECWTRSPESVHLKKYATGW